MKNRTVPEAAHPVATARRISATAWAAGLGIAVFIVCMLIVFASVLPKYSALDAADSGAFFKFAHRTSVFECLLTGTAFTPQHLYWLIFPPLYAHELTYILDSFILALAGVYYLRGRHVHPLAAWAGGLALGLCGYTFTLFSAGHRGYFHMFSCSVWAFGLLIRCFETRKYFYFAMLGLVFAWGVPYQPDVLILVGALAAAYALWLTWQGERKPICPDQNPTAHNETDTPSSSRWRKFREKARTVWPRFGVSVLVLVIAGFGGLKSAMTTQIKGRDEQIVRATGHKESEDATKNVPSAKEKHDRWIFATNWSLPPEDMLEFIVPGVFGNESMRPPHPYWGRLGRPADEVFQAGRMMPNFRQHTVYLGIIPVFFALLGIIGYTQRKKTIEPSLQEKNTADFTDVPFWCGVWVICLILAMGRYTPVYHLFYAVPYMDYIRAPVKFHHLVEIATAFLAGFGMNVFLQRDPVIWRRKWVISIGIAVTVLIMLGLMATVAQKQLIRHITELGLSPVASSLATYTLHNFARSICLAVVLFGIAMAGDRFHGWKKSGVACLLLIALSIDQAAVAERYVRALNMEPFYVSNAVTMAMTKDAAHKSIAVVNYAKSNAPSQDWFGNALSEHSIRNMIPGSEERDTPLGKLFIALEKNPLRLWQICHAQYVILPRKSCEPLLRAGIANDVLDFELGAGTVRRQEHITDKTLTLARFRTNQQGPRFLLNWEGNVPADQQVQAVSTGNSDVSDAPPPPTGPARPDSAGELRVISERGQPGSFSTRINVAAQQTGLLVFDEQKTEHLEVRIDGHRAKLFTADAIWPAVPVPAGEHLVSLRPRRNVIPLIASAFCTLFAGAWGLSRIGRPHPECTAG